MVCFAKLGLKNELASLINKTLVAEEDYLVIKNQVPISDEKLLCSNKSGTFCCAKFLQATPLYPKNETEISSSAIESLNTKISSIINFTVQIAFSS